MCAPASMSLCIRNVRAVEISSIEKAFWPIVKSRSWTRQSSIILNFFAGPTVVNNLNVLNTTEIFVILTWEMPNDGSFNPSHYNITCVPTNGRDFVAAASVIAEDFLTIFNNGTFYFDSSAYFELPAGTPFRCSVESQILSDCDYSQLGDVVYGSATISKDVTFNTEGNLLVNPIW